MESTRPRNVNIYWLGATGLLSSWFVIGGKSLPAHILKRNDTRIHLFGSALTAMSCCLNIYGIPGSYTKKYRYLHTYIGKIGLIASFVGATAGLARITSVYIENGYQLDGMIVGLGYTGIYQLYCTYKVYTNINKFLTKNSKDTINSGSDNSEKKDYLPQHVKYAHYLFTC